MLKRSIFVAILVVILPSSWLLAGPPSLFNPDSVELASCYGSAPGMIYEGGEPYMEEGCTSGGCTSIFRNSCFLACAPRWSAGVEFALLRPHFESNTAFTTLNSDGDTFETFTETDFMYDRELSPRVWIHARDSGSLGMRAVYWQFDHAAATATGTPPANGFGRVSPPDFGDIDLSTTIPGTEFIADSEINAYSIDLEMTKSLEFGRCGVLTAVGLRYAAIEQRYFGTLRSATDVTQGTVNFTHDLRGIGPTIAVRSQRPLTPQLAIFGTARGSLVYGSGSSILTSIEDQDLDTQLTTNRTVDRDDFIPIGEMQVGLQWTPAAVGMVLPYVHLAMESQVWNGVGNASSEDGNMGFFGFNVAVGIDF